MRKCGQCHWFNTKFKVGDSTYACKEFKIQANDIACGDFQSDKFTAKETKEAIIKEAAQGLIKDDKKHNSEVFNISQKANLFNIVTDIFTIEQDVSIVIDKIKAEINAQGIYLPFDSNLLERQTSKMSRLYLTYRMAISMGMGGYVDEIMKFEIEKLFADPKKYQRPLLGNVNQPQKETE